MKVDILRFFLMLLERLQNYPIWTKNIKLSHLKVQDPTTSIKIRCPFYNCPGYDQFGISRKGSQDTSDEHCTIFYDKEKVSNMSPAISCYIQLYSCKFCYWPINVKWLSGTSLIIYILIWSVRTVLWLRWSFLKVVHFGCQNHPLSLEAYRGGQWCHVLLPGQYPFKLPYLCIIYMSRLLSFLWCWMFLLPWHDFYTFQLKRVEPPGFSFQIVNTNLDEFSPRARRRSALLTWQHIASLPPNLPVVYCGGFNTQKESTTGRFLLGRSRYVVINEIHLYMTFIRWKFSF